MKNLKSNFKINKSINFSSLSEDEKESIYSTAVKVLEQTGANIFDEEAKSLLKNAGCWVDGDRVRFPIGLIEWAINVAPSRIIIYDRNGEPAMYLEDDNAYFGPGPSNNSYRDPYLGEKREPLKKDKADVARVCDYLPNIDFVMDLGTPADVTDNLADLHAFDAMIRNTTKPIVHWGFELKQYKYIYEIAKEVAGGEQDLESRPFLILYSEPSSPLLHSEEAISKAIFCAQKRIPVVYTPGVMSGATSPVTLAATLVMGIAESLVGLTVSQLVRKGTPFIMGGVYYIMDMITTVPSFGSPEFNAMQAAIAEVAHYMGIPIFGTAGCTDSCTIDGQAAAEAAMSTLTAIQSGAQLVHDVGYIESGMTGSVEQLVMGDEIISMIRSFIKGININSVYNDIELIDHIGPGGSFRYSNYKNYTSQIWSPELLNRQNFNEWTIGGGKSMEERIREKTIRIIEEHQVDDLPKEKLNKIDKIIAKAEKYEKKENREG